MITRLIRVSVLFLLMLSLAACHPFRRHCGAEYDGGMPTAGQTAGETAFSSGT